MEKNNDSLDERVAKATMQYWLTRNLQKEKQVSSGRKDQGTRSAVTGGAQMDGFITLIREIITEAGIEEACVFFKQHLVLPGFFRPTKEWDILVVKNNRLIAAIETKSQVGPSFGNNFNNRTEEALGSALDIWTAFREGAFKSTIKPWLGYFFFLEDCKESQRPVQVKESHFSVFEEFREASYTRRYELFCRKLVRERHYDSAALVTSSRERGQQGIYSEPAEDLAFRGFVRSLKAHIAAFGTEVL